MNPKTLTGKVLYFRNPDSLKGKKYLTPNLDKCLPMGDIEIRELRLSNLSDIIGDTESIEDTWSFTIAVEAFTFFSQMFECKVGDVLQIPFKGKTHVWLLGKLEDSRAHTKQIKLSAPRKKLEISDNEEMYHLPNPHTKNFSEFAVFKLKAL